MGCLTSKIGLRGPLILGTILIIAALLPARTQGAPPAVPPLPADAEKIGDDVYRLGKLTVDLKSKTATCHGKINMQRGVVEYFACAPHGKLHESVLEVDVRPLHLQLALILLGLEPEGGLRYQGDTQ